MSSNTEANPPQNESQDNNTTTTTTNATAIANNNNNTETYDKETLWRWVKHQARKVETTQMATNDTGLLFQNLVRDARLIIFAASASGVPDLSEGGAVTTETIQDVFAHSGKWKPHPDGDRVYIDSKAVADGSEIHVFITELTADDVPEDLAGFFKVGSKNN